MRLFSDLHEMVSLFAGILHSRLMFRISRADVYPHINSLYYHKFIRTPNLITALGFMIRKSTRKFHIDQELKYSIA